MSTERIRGIRDSILIAGFVIMIAMPLVVLLLNNDPSLALSENRQLANAPSLGAEFTSLQADPTNTAAWTQLLKGVYAYPNTVEGYFNDQFGLRNALIRAHSYLVLQGFPTQSDVIVGRDDWLFFGHQQVLATYRATEPFDDAELEAWRQSLLSQSQWLEEQGIKQLIVIAPEKSTIYPEFMPGNISRPGKESRTDAFIRFVDGQPNIQILDLRGPLLDAKESGELLYLRTDSHWNEPGALIAAQAILARLREDFPAISEPARSDYRVSKQTFSGDLAGLLALRGVLTEESIRLEPLDGRRAEPTDPGIGPYPQTEDWAQPQSTSVDDPSLPTAVVFRDSFGSSLIPFLSEGFSRITYVHLDQLPWQASILHGEMPDVVIYEFAERTFHQGNIFDVELEP